MSKLNSVIFALVLLAVYLGGVLSGALLQGTEFEQKNLLPLEKKKYESSVAILAVVQGKRVGMVSEAQVEITEGKGRVLFNTNPFVEPDTQESVKVAAEVAEEFTGKSLKGKDVIYSVEGKDMVLVGGPSAGAAITVATIAAIEEKKIKENTALTGTIQPDGRIGPVGGILEKAAAFAESGGKLFLVPKGQGTLTYYEQEVKEEKKGPFVIKRINYIPKTINLNDYTTEQWGMETKEVSNIKEAVEHLVE